MDQNIVENLARTRVVVHPLVLLSVVDHYNRVSKNSKKRVVGVLMGQVTGNLVNVANSYAVPFEEEYEKVTNSTVFFLDHNYVETMRDMFKKVNIREHLIGWYHSGPSLQPIDLEINELFKKYTPNPVLVVVNVAQEKIGLPTKAYFAVERIHDDGTATTKNFEHVSSEIGAEEAEEIGVEHLLRDVKGTSLGSLTQRLAMQIESLKSLSERLVKIRNYLKNVVDNSLPLNFEIIQNLQKIFNLLPKMVNRSDIELFSGQKDERSKKGAHVTDPEQNAVITRATNDSYLIIYISNLIRSIIALHDLINNKIQNREAEAANEKSSTATLNPEPVPELSSTAE
ncbi:26S proteasome regulatory subunit rpn-8 [Smittium mucronatum]|uniref:26S proteasome regulatory subunit rpn-8 n=1 Tax=Smittium mucronatum TaxID=133383 RepID=A0A1R0GU00_9FUNG|nr:26S proteasome regulatory subunit rpn-8 [Smittium mucronatum]